MPTGKYKVTMLLGRHPEMTVGPHTQTPQLHHLRVSDVRFVFHWKILWIKHSDISANMV
jgi:hypothetical protein